MIDVDIRPERDDDSDAIRDVVNAAFASAAHSSGTEAKIVEALRNEEALVVSLVAERQRELVGHVAVSPVQISDGTPGWFGLGPIAVAPSYQRQGVGSALMTRALLELEALKARGCVLVGEPDYYGRFGFSAVPDLTYPDVPPEYFLALSFGDTYPSGSVTYHRAFSAG